MAVEEINQIIAAANAAYREFAKTSADREVRQAVSNAVKFLTADLNSINELASTGRRY